MSTGPTALTPSTNISPPDQKVPSNASSSGDAVPNLPVNEKHSVHALIIGIDTYKSSDMEDLDGCVTDAEGVKEFLETSFVVPPKNIITLTNESATRAAILQALHHLESSPRIQKDDPILVYYAGHGATADPPQEWDTDEQVELLVPHDFEREGEQVLVHAIPDRTIVALLQRIADKKGNNITVILDCCHSGSVARAQELEPGTKTRGIGRIGRLPAGIDKDEESVMDRDVHQLQTSLYGSLESYVLLAACHKDEYAQEKDGRGLFTTALLKALASFHSRNLSYRNLIQKIGRLSRRQNPQCDGKHIDRSLFDSALAIQRLHAYNVVKQQGKYVMQAGAAEGITSGSLFNIYQLPAWIELGTLTASNPESFTTEMLLGAGFSPFDVDGEVVALPRLGGDDEALLLHISEDTGDKEAQLVKRSCEEARYKDNHGLKVSLVDRNLAHLEIKSDANGLLFQTLYHPATKYGVKDLHLQVTLDPNDIKQTIRAAARYHWHLRRSLAVKSNNLSSVEFIVLQRTFGIHYGSFQKTYVPQGANLIEDGIVSLSGGGSSSLYGIKYTNDFEHPVNVWAFFFHHSDFTIDEIYRPPITSIKNKDVTLKTGESITIGYGDGGGEPFYFELDEGYDVDVSFLVLFVSKKSIDLGAMAQDPSGGKGHRMEKDLPGPAADWHTHVIPIVQRRNLMQE